MRILLLDNSSLLYCNGRFFTNSLNGQFVEELIRKGNKVVYCHFESNLDHGIKNFDLEQHGIAVLPLKPIKNKIIRYIVAFFKIFGAILKMDFVYLYYPTSFKHIPFICRILRKPYGLYVRGMNGLDDKISKINYQHAYAVFTVSNYFTDKVNGITQKDNAYTIRPMISYTDADVVKGRIYKKKNEYNLLYLGRIDRDKGLVELIRASKQLLDKGYRFKLQIVGSGDFSYELNQLVEELSISDFVCMVGPLLDHYDKAQCYKDADLYILPTYHEGFPRTLYEAMIFGTPIVTTFVGGIPSIMKDGENCKRIEPRSVESIVDGISVALDNYEEMGKMAENASVIVTRIVNRKRMTHAEHLNQLLELYGE